MHLLDYINSTGRAERAIGDVNIPAFDEENPVGGRHLSRADRNITQTYTQILHCKIVRLTRRLSLDALGRKLKSRQVRGIGYMLLVTNIFITVIRVVSSSDT